MTDREAAGDEQVERMSTRFGPDEPDEQSDPSEPSKPSKLDEPDEPEETGEPSETDETDESSVKDERVGTYMYLPEPQKKQLSRQYDLLKADYEYEFEDQLEKNRHFYPLVAEYGLDSLDELSASDVRDRLENNNWLE